MEHFRRFWDAQAAKFELRAKGKDRSDAPWDEHTRDFLASRLIEEWGELRNAQTWGNEAEISDELIDVANFCMFLWLSYNRKE